MSGQHFGNRRASAEVGESGRAVNPLPRAEQVRSLSRPSTGHELAFGILCAALGEVRAWSLWNRWTADQRNEIAAFAEGHYGPQIRSLADELIAWEERHADT